MNKNDLEKTIKINISNLDLFITAFIHRSYLNEHKDQKIESNERLEFLGDAVLQFLVTDFLYHRFENTKEGILTAYRASLVNTNSLAFEAKRLRLGQFLRLSKGEELNKGRENTYILANTFEAVIGAIYLDKGLEETKKFLNKNLFYKLAKIIEEESYKDSKSAFQEKAQETEGVTPTYKVIKEWGPDHNKKFKVAVCLGKKQVATGVGNSKQKAEIQAAKKALEKYKT